MKPHRLTIAVELQTFSSRLATKNAAGSFSNCFHVCSCGGQAKPRWPHILELSAVFVHWRNWYLATVAMFTNSLLGALLYGSETHLQPLVPTLSIHPPVWHWSWMKVLSCSSRPLRPSMPPLRVSGPGLSTDHLYPGLSGHSFIDQRVKEGRGGSAVTHTCTKQACVCA